jgi:hypothetical protein
MSLEYKLMQRRIGQTKMTVARREGYRLEIVNRILAWRLLSFGVGT